VLIRLKSIQDYPLLVNSIATYNIQSVNLCDFDERTYLLTIDKSSNKDAMQIANELYETEMFEYAEPNLIHFIKFETNDTYFPDQWALNNTGQYGGTAGIDIKANQAWTITTGSPDVRIAILDLGVDLTHPDLETNLLTGFDATGGSGNGAAVNNIAHGTACAGIAAAIGDNDEGIAGVAYGCNILPVRIATTTSGWTSAESQYIASGINWARANGASVISMSFTCVETDILNTAISNAITSGRNNNGCVLIAATGNDNLSTVGYPARHTNVIAVGAISPCGERKSYSSCDEESWGSNYGTNLDVVAPGVLIPTTDLQGSAGYNPNLPIHTGNGGNIVTSDYTDQDYTVWFNGTSAACPHVAGVAALILSANPDLTQAQVRSIIESTAQKVGGYNYQTTARRPNGTWHQEMGYGLVDAYAAVMVAANFPILVGASTICSSSAIYTLSPGSATSWSVAPTSAFSVTASNATSATVKALNYAGTQGTLTAIVNGVAVTKIVQTCTFNVSISGPSTACYSTTVTFTVTGAPAGYTWSNSSNLTLLSTSGNTASFRAGTATGSAWVRILVNGVQAAQHNFSIAETPAGTIISYNGVYSSPGTYLFSASGVPSNIADLNIQWELIPSICYSTLYAGRNPVISFNVHGSHILKMRYSGTCGYSPYATKSISVTGGSNNCYSLLSAYPNPASSVLDIEIEEELQTMLQSSSSAAISSPESVYRVRLVSVQTGAVEYNQVLSSSSGNLSVNVSTIPDGLYNLTLTQGSTMLHSETILIQH
jgi:hypothetical protein